MNHDKVAILDLDDTLTDWRSGAAMALSAYTNKNIHWTNWTTYDIDTMYGCEPEEVLDVTKKARVFETSKPHDKTPFFLKRLRDNDYKIVIVTARGWFKGAKEMTEEWFKRNELPFDEIIVTQMSDNKADHVVQRYKHVDFTLDDSYRHCVHYYNSGLTDKVFMYSMPWNSEKSWAKRVDCLSQVAEVLKIK